MLRRLLSWLPGSSGDDDRPSPEQRAERVREIGRDPLAHGHDATEEVLAALSDDSPLVRATAAEVLGSVEVYHELVAADPLVERLDDADRRVRLAAAEALTVTTDATVVDDVFPYALADDPGVRAAGAVGLYRSLARITYEFAPAQTEALLDAFVAAGSDETDPEDRRLAREHLLAALERGAPPADLVTLDDDHAAALIDGLTDGPTAVRRRAARLLGHVDGETANESLREASEHDPDERVRTAASEALADGER